MGQRPLPGSQVLIRQHGETVYEKCFGYGNLENQLKIKNDSILHVASISKEFTVLSILLLWKEGKLGLDDDIRKYVGEYINIEEPITVRQMMNNVSGSGTSGSFYSCAASPSTTRSPWMTSTPPSGSRST